MDIISVPKTIWGFKNENKASLILYESKPYGPMKLKSLGTLR